MIIRNECFADGLIAQIEQATTVAKLRAAVLAAIDAGAL